jgi:hypothetical protein
MKVEYPGIPCSLIQQFGQFENFGAAALRAACTGNKSLSANLPTCT